MTPRFISHAKGARIYDADGNEYIDFIGSWGPMILGHGHPRVLEAVTKAAQEGLSYGAATEREVIMAELICDIVPSIEMVRMVNSGTEAVMSAIRAASGLMTQGIPGSAGVPEGCTKDTLTAVYNDLDSVR